MTFTQEVKRELCSVQPVEAHCSLAEASGIIFGAGTAEIASRGHVAVRVTTGMAATARRLLSLLRVYRVDIELRTVQTAPVGRRYEVVLDDVGRGMQVLNELGVLSDSFQIRVAIPERVIKRKCCLVAFLRGMFLGCGSISAPGSPVHAEFTVEDAGLGEELARQLSRVGLGFSVVDRRRNVGVYTKRGETAADLLTVLGAHDARLRWEEHQVLGRVREDANRLANCDEANARRAAAAGVRQAAAARRLMASDRWASVPPAVRDVAKLRVSYPYLSLDELGRRTRPRLSRSALNHRLRRMVALADEIETTAGRAGSQADGHDGAPAAAQGQVP